MIPLRLRSNETASLAVGVADLLQSALLGVVPENGITPSLLGVASLAYYYPRRRETRRERARLGTVSRPRTSRPTGRTSP
ncbi:MAG: hypothetical protein ABEJ78_02120 [Haloferacaceae archaeon]